MTWTYKNEPLTEIPEGYTSFVYLITNKVTGKKYVGKKMFRFTRTKKVKGRKQRKTVASDWLGYFGSNKELNEHVELYGEDKFQREILYLCKTKGEASYYEAKEQFLRDVLLSSDYYNSWISCKIARNHLPKRLDN